MKNLSLHDAALVARTRAAGGAVTPASFAGLEGWWKADSYSLPDGTTVFDSSHKWADQSGNARVAWDQGNAVDPTFNTNQFNGLPALTMDGGRWGKLDAEIDFGTGDFTAIMVLKATGTSGMFGSAVNNNRRILYVPSTGTLILHSVNDNYQTTAIVAGTNLVMLTCLVRGGFAHFFENGTNKDQLSMAWTGPESFIWLGTDATAFNLNGSLCEACLYSQGLADANVASLYSNYFNRWGI